MKNIVVFVKNLTSGGAEKQSVLLAIALSKLYTVHYVVLNGSHQEPKYLKLLQSHPSITYKAFHGNLLVRFFQFLQYLRYKKIHILFSYLTAANFFAVIASRLSKGTKVYTGIRNAYLPPVKSFIDKLLCNYFASKTILNCFSGQDFFRNAGFQEDKMLVIPNCFENIDDFVVKDQARDIIRIITVGRFVEQKDYFTALESIRKLSEIYTKIVYQIVGYGELEEAIREKVAELKIESFVEIYINPANIAQLFSEADIYLSTSLFEGTSNSIMEAMNADLPIVATDVGDNYKLVISGETGFLVEIQNVEQIVSCIKELIDNPNKLLEMGKQSKLHLKNNYSMEKFRDRYLQLLNSEL